MPELDPVRQDIEANAAAYLAALDAMIEKAEAFAAAVSVADEALAGFANDSALAAADFGLAADKANALRNATAGAATAAEGASGRINDLRDSTAGLAGADDIAADSMSNLVRIANYLNTTFGIIGISEEVVLAKSRELFQMNNSLAASFDIVRSQVQGTMMAEAQLTAINESLAESFDIVSRNATTAMLTEAQLSEMNDRLAVSFGTLGAQMRLEAELEADLAAHNALLAASAIVAADAERTLAEAQTLVTLSGIRAGAGVGEAAAAMDQAANSAQRTYTWWNLSGNAIHWIISGSAELLAVLLPATVAAGAWAAAWLQGATNVYQHITAVYGATEAMANITHITAGQVLGLGDALQKAQNEANPDVYQALGGAINLVKESAGGLAQAGVQMGKIFDDFMAKVVYDFSAAGKAGQTLGELLSHMQSDLVGVGQFFGNLGAALASFASQMPGLAEVLLQLLDIITGGIKDVIEFAATLHIGTVSVLTLVMAFEEFNRWGTLLVGLLGRVGLATSEVSGGFLTAERGVSVFMNLFRALPTLVGSLSMGLGTLVGRMAGIVPGAEGAGTAMTEFGGALKLGVMEIGFWQAALITAAAVGLGILIDKLVTAQSSAQQFSESLQKDAQAANNLQVFTVIAENMNKLQVATGQATHQLNQQESQLSRTAGSAGAYAKGLIATQVAVNYTKSAIDAYNAGMVQQISDAGNVVTGANQIAKAYGLTVPQAMTLAQSAGVNLTGAVKNQAGQWTVLGQKVADAYQGYRAMGQSATAVGNDMLALAIQEGEAGTKMAQLNQAWDSWMQTVTGGTGGMASFAQSLQNIGNVVGTTTNNLGAAQSISLTTKQFADALTSYGNQGAQAWTNFDQVVGSTAPNLVDWLRTAGTMGAASGKQIQQAGLDMISGLAPLAVHSQAAQTELLALAQNAGLNVTTFPQLEGLIKSTSANVNGLGGIVNTVTGNLGSMASAAQNLGDVMNSALTTAMSTAALKASGFYQAQTNLTNAIKTYGANSPQAEQAAQILTQDWDNAQQMAGKVAQEANAAQKAINAMQGKAITITVSLAGDGAKYMGYAGTGSSGVYTATTTAGFGGYAGRAAGGFIDGPGTKTSDSIPVRASRGEFMMQAAAVDHYGRGVMEAMNARKLAAGGPVTGGGGPASSVLAASGSGGGSTTLTQNQRFEVKLDNAVIGSQQRTQVLTYNRRNPSANWGLRTR